MANLNSIFVKYIIEELSRAGVKQFVCAPGGRSAPLVVEVASRKDLNLSVHSDERGAGFFALGISKASGKPAVLITTSGTAVANLYPAVIEASQTNTPLIVLSADLPKDLSDSGVSQSIKQVGIFGDYLRWSVDLSNSLAPANTLTAVDQAIYRSVNSPAGPVQINCRFVSPLLKSSSEAPLLESSEKLQAWNESSSLFTNYLSVEPTSGPEALQEVADEINRAKNGLLLVGTLPTWMDKSSIDSLIKKLSWPVVADISSGIERSSSRDLVLSHADLLLRTKQGKDSFKADTILHLGGELTHNPINTYLKSSSAKRILVNSHPFRQDPASNLDVRLQSHPDSFAKQITALLENPSSEMKEELVSLNKACDREVSAHLESANFSEVVAAKFIAESSDKERALFIGNSWPIRLFDSLAGSFKFSGLMTNRGASGIDGQIATACGLSKSQMGAAKGVTVILGDQSTLHDLNSLQLTGQLENNFIVVVFNNFGGAIFSSISDIKESEQFEKYFLAEHELEFSKAAEFYNLSYARAESLEALEQAYKLALEGNKKTLIEVISDSGACNKFYEDVSSFNFKRGD